MRGLGYNFECIVFASLILLLSMKVNINNKVLCWLGFNLFPIYIYQRIPMIAIKSLAGDEFLVNYPYSYVIICFSITIIIAYFYKYWRILPEKAN